ncbi:unnamed protein product [Lymnaea stagnalis]|uniref:Antistasin-like domain-containing protein n=1 Tax=Lymnaea stagnalis TaxID=6523 RepID=A0AAV2IHQ1_LYMST
MTLNVGLLIDWLISLHSTLHNLELDINRQISPGADCYCYKTDMNLVLTSVLFFLAVVAGTPVIQSPSVAGTPVLKIPAIECPLVRCLPCDNGFVIDDDGCQTCMCKDSKRDICLGNICLMFCFNGFATVNGCTLCQCA